MNAKGILTKQAMLTSGSAREKYKWVLLVFLFVAFFLELGSRQLYNAVLPMIRLEVSALCDTSLIRSLGWAPKIDLATGIRRTVDEYRAELASGRIRL